MKLLAIVGVVTGTGLLLVWLRQKQLQKQWEAKSWNEQIQVWKSERSA